MSHSACVFSSPSSLSLVKRSSLLRSLIPLVCSILHDAVNLYCVLLFLASSLHSSLFSKFFILVVVYPTKRKEVNQNKGKGIFLFDDILAWICIIKAFKVSLADVAKMISQGASKVNISLVVNDSEAEQCVKALPSAFSDNEECALGNGSVSVSVSALS